MLLWPYRRGYLFYLRAKRSVPRARACLHFVPHASIPTDAPVCVFLSVVPVLSVRPVLHLPLPLPSHVNISRVPGSSRRAWAYCTHHSTPRIGLMSLPLINAPLSPTDFSTPSTASDRRREAPAVPRIPVSVRSSVPALHSSAPRVLGDVVERGVGATSKVLLPPFRGNVTKVTRPRLPTNPSNKPRS